MAPTVVDHRVGLPIRWPSWQAWRIAQQPRSPRRNVWVIDWHLSPFGTPVAAGWVGFESWRHWKFAQRCPELVALRKHEDGGLFQSTVHPEDYRADVERMRSVGGWREAA